jgi:hypothetical protein
MASLTEDAERLRGSVEGLIALLPESAQREIAAADERKKRLAEQLRQHCADAIASVADALRFPNIARVDLEAAQVAIAKALSVAAALDPEDA